MVSFRHLLGLLSSCLAGFSYRNSVGICFLCSSYMPSTLKLFLSTKWHILLDLVTIIFELTHYYHEYLCHIIHNSLDYSYMFLLQFPVIYFQLSK